MKIILTTTKFVKNPNTKTTYIEVEKETKEIPEQHYINATSKNTVRFMKRLGGSESSVMAYTCAGYKCVKSVSISPDRENKTVREYSFTY